jgi:hypothetical protein
VRFARRVLLTEVAVQLAQNDMGIPRNEAIDIIKISTQYGMTMHTQTDSVDSDEQQYFSDLKKRWSAGGMSRMKIEEDSEEMVVKTEPGEPALAMTSSLGQLVVECRVVMENGQEVYEIMD